MAAATRTWSRFIGVVVVLAVIAVVGVGVWRGVRPSVSSGNEKVVIAQAGDFFLYAPLYVALDGGYFQDEKLDVSLITTGGDEKTWAAVLSENASFGVADPTFVAVSDARGVPGKVVAGIVNGVPFWGVTLRKDAKAFVSPKDLDGFTVATFPSPSTAYTLQHRMFEEAGIQPRIREGAFGTLIAMLRSGQADIALELEPNVSQLVADGGTVVYSLSNLYGDFAMTGLTTTPAYLTQHADTARKVANALQKALTAIHNDRSRALALLQKRFPEIDPAVAKAALERVIADRIIPESLHISQDAWDKAIQLRIQAGDIKNPQPFASYVDNSFAKSAADRYPPK